MKIIFSGDTSAPPPFIPKQEIYLEALSEEFSELTISLASDVFTDWDFWTELCKDWDFWTVVLTLSFWTNDLADKLDFCKLLSWTRLLVNVFEASGDFLLALLGCDAFWLFLVTLRWIDLAASGVLVLTRLETCSVTPIQEY